MKKHGMRGTRTYNIWAKMKYRCKPGSLDSGAHRYGGRGITVCDRWITFENFLADMGECPLDHSIDRIDGNGNYEPANCRWATVKEQNRNQRSNRLITFNGECLPMSEWAERYGMCRRTLWGRISRGMPIEIALTRKVTKSRYA